jgi:hypothetical protein
MREILLLARRFKSCFYSSGVAFAELTGFGRPEIDDENE